MSTLRPDKDNLKIVNVSIFPANKGLFSSIPATLIKHEELNKSNNLIHTTHGSRRTRPGIDPYYVSGFGSDNPVQALFDFYRTNAGVKNQKVVAVENGRVFADSANGSFTNITGVVPTFSSTIPCSMDALVGFLVIGRQGLAPLKWQQSGTVSLLGGSPPNGWMIRRHLSSIWSAGDASNPEVLSKSDTENPEEWALGTADSFNIDLGDPDPVGITGISPSFYNRIYVGKWDAIYEIQTYSGVTQVVPFIQTIGFASHNAIVATQTDLLFPSVRGIHSLQTSQNYGDIDSTFISFPVQDIWNSIVDFTKSQLMSAAFIPEYNSYLITFPRRGSTNFDTLGFNIQTGDIFYWEGFNASFFTLFRDSYKRTRLMIGTTQGNIGLGKTMSDTDFTDFLEAFGSGFTTGSIFPTYQPKSVWQFKQLTVFFRPQGHTPIQVAYKIDNKDVGEVSIDQSGTGGTPLGSFLLGSTTLGGNITYTQITKEIQGYGNSIQLDASVDPEDTSIGMEIYGYEIECEQVGDSTIPVATE